MIRSFSSRAGLALGLAFSGLALLPVSPVAAAPFPDKPVRIVVPFPAGGSNDVIARLVGAKLGEQWGQTVIIENRGGAGGNIGAEAVARSAPDGATLLLTAPGPLAINQALYAKLSFDPGKDFAPVALIASVPIVLAVHPDVKAKTVGELVALAKAAPGTMNFGSSGNGSTNHLVGELFKAPGQIQMMFDNMPAIRPQVLGGTIRALAVAGAARSPLFPDVPTMVEAGVPDFEASSWFGMVAPSATPPEVLSQLTASVGKVLQDPDVVKKLSEIGAEPGALSGAAFGAFLRSEAEKWGKVAMSAGVKLD
jgi:tripartite-type tricarboxylate transporter receptor subunit TctC